MSRKSRAVLGNVAAGKKAVFWRNQKTAFFLLLCLLMLISIHTQASAQTVSIDIYATGVDNNHTVIADSTVDPHWQVTQSADSSYPGPNAYVVRSDLFPLVSGPWLSNTSTSKWISVLDEQDVGVAPGTYVYTQTFDLTGLDPATAQLSGYFASDDTMVYIKLNGVNMGQGGGNFISWSSFSLTSGFTSGTNTLSFYVTNGGSSDNPSAFRAEVSGTADSLDTVPIDIHATGVDIYHDVIADSTVDPHWQVTQSADWSCPGPAAYVVRSDLFPIVSGPWLSNSSTSKWISVYDEQDVGVAPGTYVYTQTFDLAGLYPATAQLSGRFSSDDTLDHIELNGVNMGQGGGNFISWSSFSLTSGFTSGTNTISFYVTNDGSSDNPSAFRAEISGTAVPAIPTVLNASFEYPYVSGYQYAPTGTDWDHTGTGFIIADEGFYTTQGTGTSPFNGSQIMILEETVSVSQDITGFTPGQSYKVSWAEADDNNNSIRVSIDSTVLWNGSPVTNNDWVVQTSNSFQATDTTHTLTIEGTNAWNYSGATVLVDSIVITQVGGMPGPPASNPCPANSASNIPRNITLSWTSGQAATSHDVYFGTDPTPDNGEFKVNTTETNYDPGQLSPNTTYYWKIRDVTTLGRISGPVWSFTTGSTLTPFTLWQLPPYGDSDHHTMSYVIQTGNDGKVIVVDGGYSDDAPYLKSFLGNLGNHVDMWFVTHRHRDHIRCLTTILNSPGNVTIDKIYASMPSLSWLQTYDTNAYNETVLFNSALSGAGKSVTEVSLGQMIYLDGVAIKIMGVNNPARVSYGDNDQSIAFKLYDGSKTFMFLGDLWVEGGNELLANFGSEVDSDYVQMAHHGQQGVGYNVYEAITADYCFWPLPYWVWQMDTAQEVLGWVNYLGAQGHYYMFNGLQSIQ